MSRPILLILFALCAYGAATAQVLRPPRIWDDAALADWATPVAGLNIRPAHYSSVEYDAAPVDNLKTYPFYPVDREPPGYWEWLQKQTPQPLIDANELRTNEDWIAAGERAFHELDAVLVRTEGSQPDYPRTRPRVAARVTDPFRWFVRATPVGCHFRWPHVVGASVRGVPYPCEIPQRHWRP